MSGSPDRHWSFVCWWFFSEHHAFVVMSELPTSPPFGGPQGHLCLALGSTAL